MAGSMIEVKGPNETFDAYLAAPEGGKGPGVVVIQEIFGVNAQIKGICDRLAAKAVSRSRPTSSGASRRASI